MLRELRIQNFAIIDDLRISFGPGLNVITGETGSGKSVIIGALTLLCGGRADADIVRSDCDAASIEGLFDHPEPGTSLETLGLGPDDEVLIRRLIPQTGKGRVYLNGSPATVAMLNALGSRLVHVYGQHDQSLLLHPQTHLDFLDAFGALLPLRTEMAAAYTALEEARAQWQRLDDLRAHHDERRDLLAFQIDELGSARIEPGEEARLRQARERLRHADRLQQVCSAAEAALYSSDAATVATLARLGTQLHEAMSIDPAFAEPQELVDAARLQLEDVALQLRKLGGHLHADPEQLAVVDDRLAMMTRLSRKYRVPADELAATLAALQHEMSTVENVEAECAAVEALVASHRAEAMQVAARLTTERARVARDLEAQMGAELETLGMHGALLRVQRSGDETGGASQLDATGCDHIEFLLSANPGEPPKPLARIASGGELSRIMLGLKALTARIAETPILIFDEVDAGIGGTVADAVARRLATLAQTRQLLCITHLPQIAAYADQHFAVEKRHVRGRTIAQARPLAAAERVQELTRMLGGVVAPSEAAQYAERLLHQARSTASTRAPRASRRAARS